MSIPAWDPKLYLTFDAERTRPASELAMRVQVVSPRTVVDVGCGPGNSTAVLRSRWPEAAVTGVDRDGAMLARAKREDPEVRWLQADAASWEPSARFDVVFSNALLHWLPDQAAALRHLFAAVAPGGALAVQVPMHQASAVHRHMLELAARPEWAVHMAGVQHAVSHHPATYYYDAVCAVSPRIDLWETDYHHVLETPSAILDWMRGTGLRPFLSALPTDDDRRAFEAALQDRVTVSYPRRPDGRVLYPFRRLFLVAYRP